MKAALACALAALAASAAYWGTLDNGFAWDDHVHIEAAPFVQDARNARVLLTPGFWKGSTPVEGSARPLLLASLLADRALWGPNPGGYHLDSLLLHAACAAALAWLAFLLLGSAEAAALAGALFALHPVQSEAVCGITFRADPLAALGVILALAFLRMAFTRRSAAWSAAAAAAFGLGLLAKENAAVFPALALLMELLFPSGPAAARARRTAALLAAAALAAYAAFRIPRRGYGPSAAAHGAAPPAPTRTATQFHESPPEWKEAMRDPATRVRTMSGVLGDYARLTLWPAGLQADRSAPVVTRWSAARAWTGWLVLLVVLAGAWAARAALPAAAFGLAWFLVALTPVSGVVALPNLIAERYLYLAVAGAALAAAAALEAASRRLPKPRLALLALSACLLAPAFAATRARVPAWRDDDALFGAPAPTESSRLDYNKGYLAQQSGRLDEAEKHYRRALELNHRSIEPMVNLAYVERVLARPEEGLALLRRAVSVDPRSSTAYEALGDALEAAGKREEALEAYHRAVG
ncbi:MAG TPA: tetratricopeptide repeat protein, partial [Elusimicrobiota bacterium]|nr:tetratricopeptide repeat protein [Elusimicrobiota bacterium]